MVKRCPSSLHQKTPESLDYITMWSMVSWVHLKFNGFCIAAKPGPLCAAKASPEARTMVRVFRIRLIHMCAHTHTHTLTHHAQKQRISQELCRAKGDLQHSMLFRTLHSCMQQSMFKFAKSWYSLCKPHLFCSRNWLRPVIVKSYSATLMRNSESSPINFQEMLRF